MARELKFAGKAAMTAALASMMREERMSELFRVARLVAGEAQSASEDVGPLKRRLRFDYAVAASCVLWMLAIVVLVVTGKMNPFLAVTNLLLMLATCINLYREISDQRRKLQAIEREERRDRRDRVQMGMAAFAEMMRRMAQRNDEDEED